MTAAIRWAGALLAAGAALAADAGWGVAGQIALPGPTRWDYVHVDQAAHRLYVAHGTQTDIVDTTQDRLVGRLLDTPGVHGVAVAAEFGRVYTSNGAAGQIGVYDLADQRRLATIAAGANPDAIVYEPLSRRVVVFNGRSHDATLADAASGAVVVAALPVGGKPEFAVVGPGGRVYFNVEDTAEVAVLDARSASIVARYSIAPCREPTGLDIDPRGRLYSVCGNGLMIVSDPATGRVLGQAAIGAGADGVVWIDGQAISANGRDGTASVVAETGPGSYATLATLPVAYGARTIAADRALHKLYLPSADYAAPAPTASAPARRTALPDSAHLLVLARRS